MNIPCRIKALKYIKHGDNLEMKSGSYAEVTVETDSPKNWYRLLRVTADSSTGFLTEKALENAIERGEFSVV